MCSALEELVNEGMEKGRQEGRQEGKLEGKLEGRQEGIREGIIANIRICKKFNMSKSDIIESIMQDFSLSEKEASEYVERYW